MIKDYKNYKASGMNKNWAWLLIVLPVLFALIATIIEFK